MCPAARPDLPCQHWRGKDQRLRAGHRVDLGLLQRLKAFPIGRSLDPQMTKFPADLASGGRRQHQPSTGKGVSPGSRITTPCASSFVTVPSSWPSVNTLAVSGRIWPPKALRAASSPLKADRAAVKKGLDSAAPPTPCCDARRCQCKRGTALGRSVPRLDRSTSPTPAKAALPIAKAAGPTLRPDPPLPRGPKAASRHRAPKPATGHDWSFRAAESETLCPPTAAFGQISSETSGCRIHLA